MKFEYLELKKFLQYIAANYKVTTLKDWDGSNSIILRHDLELCVEDAYKIHLLEKECGIKSSIFVLTTCHSYNPASEKNRLMLQEINKNGFEIGLHFDPTIYQPGENLQKKVEEEANYLSSIIGNKVKSVSLHRPALTHKNKDFPLFKNFYNAYDPKVFSPNHYISDSNGIFRKDIYNFIKKGDNSTIQILLHPIHYMKNGKNYEDRITSFIKDFTQEIDKNFKTMSTYKNSIKNKKLFDYITKKR
jgi:hypothetical protein